MPVPCIFVQRNFFSTYFHYPGNAIYPSARAVEKTISKTKYCRKKPYLQLVEYCKHTNIRDQAMKLGNVWSTLLKGARNF